MKNIPFFSFHDMHEGIRQSVIDTFAAFFDRQWYVLGKGIEHFEKSFAQYTGTEYCVGVGNGLDALHLALKALDVKPGDEVIVPSNTYIATWLAVSFAGARIVPVEPDERTYNLDPAKIEAAITDKTKVIMPVHLYGQACDMAQITTIAKKYELFIIEDNAQAQGASFLGKKTGSFGDINAVSFYPGKNIGALGEAGAITTDDARLAEIVKILRNYGSKQKYYNELMGYNTRIDEFQAEVLSIKLNHLDAWNESRRIIADEYNVRLKDIDGLTRPYIHPKSSSVFHQYIVKTDRRDELKTFLEQRGIGTMIHYPLPPHLQKAYQHLGYGQGAFPIAEAIAETVLSLPIYPGLDNESIEYICDSIKLFHK